MPPRENKVLSGQTKKMVYHVHCFLQKESVEVTKNLKLIKKKINGAADKLQDNINRTVTKLNQIQGGLTCIDLTQTCYVLEQTKRETVLTLKAEVTELEGVMNNLKQNQKRTAFATRTSRTTVSKIVRQAETGSLDVFKDHQIKRNRAKPITDIDHFTEGVVRRRIHSFYLVYKELPTISKLKQKLHEDINYKGSDRSLQRIIKNIGFQWKKVENNRKLIIEKSKIRFQRIEFIQKIQKYRQEGRPIIYAGVSYVDSSHTNPKASTAKGPKKTISKGEKVVIVHAGSDQGFIANALMTFIKFNAATKRGDYQDTINYEIYERWLRTQLMPNLPPNSVVIVNNASYHYKLQDLAPTSNSTKAVMQAWLSENGIAFDANSLKPQLYNLITNNKEKKKFQIFSMDRILAEQSHSVLRLPPYHLDLNPIEMIWSSIKQFVGSKTEVWSPNRVIELVKEDIGLIDAYEWHKLCKNVQDIEEEYAKCDLAIDTMTEEFHNQVIDDSSDSEKSDDDISEDDEQMSTSSDDDEKHSSTSYRNTSVGPSVYLINETNKRIKKEPPSIAPSDEKVLLTSIYQTSSIESNDNVLQVIKKEPLSTSSDFDDTITYTTSTDPLSTSGDYEMPCTSSYRNTSIAPNDNLVKEIKKEPLPTD